MRAQDRGFAAKLALRRRKKLQVIELKQAEAKLARRAAELEDEIVGLKRRLENATHRLQSEIAEKTRLDEENHALKVCFCSVLR